MLTAAAAAFQLAARRLTAVYCGKEVDLCQIHYFDFIILSIIIYLFSPSKFLLRLWLFAAVISGYRRTSFLQERWSCWKQQHTTKIINKWHHISLLGPQNKRKSRLNREVPHLTHSFSKLIEEVSISSALQNILNGRKKKRSSSGSSSIISQKSLGWGVETLSTSGFSWRTQRGQRSTGGLLACQCVRVR